MQIQKYKDHSTNKSNLISINIHLGSSNTVLLSFSLIYYFMQLLLQDSKNYIFNIPLNKFK